MKILYLTGGFFPKGSAYASRTLNISRALSDFGNRIKVIADYDEARSEVSAGVIDGIQYLLSDSNKSLSLKKRVKKFCRMVDLELQKEKYDLVISSSDHDRFPRLFKIAKRHRVPLVLESCEWFGPYNWSYGRLNPRYYAFLHCWYRYYPKVDGVIAISRLLENHYKKYTSNVIRIPTVLPVLDNNQDRHSDGLIRLMYAGSAGKSKDLLNEIILAINKMNDTNKRVVLDIYGIDEKTIQFQLGNDKEVLNSIGDRVVIHGKIQQDLIHKCYCNSDYSILFRPNRRSSDAGFPTKLAESLMAGTPIICNDTGDISLYVKSGYNGFVIAEPSLDNIYNCLCQLTITNADDMRKNARDTAIESFGWKNYSAVLNDFVEKVTKDENN